MLDSLRWQEVFRGADAQYDQERDDEPVTVARCRHSTYAASTQQPRDNVGFFSQNLK
jgi:hypothetical protein